MHLRVFGYGSLMYEPACPDLVVDCATAFLPGHERAFHLRSTTRGCPAHLAGDHPPVHDFLDGDHRLSLVLGLRPGRGVWGRVHRYPREAAAHVLANLRRREGPAYHQATVRLDVDGRPHDAETWLSSWDHPWSVELTLADKARILRAATPRARGERALGAHYVLGVQEALRHMGRPDPYIDTLLDHIHGGA